MKPPSTAPHGVSAAWGFFLELLTSGCLCGKLLSSVGVFHQTTLTWAKVLFTP
jgi:hypothetical protein